MEQMGETFDFTAATPDVRRGSLRGVEIVATGIRDIANSPEAIPPELVARLDAALRRALDLLVADSLRVRAPIDELRAEGGPIVRDAFDVLLQAYRRAGGNVPELRDRRQRCASDIVFWNCVLARATPDDVWAEFAADFELAYGRQGGLISGDLQGVGRHYLRAIAFQTVELEQLQLVPLMAASRLIELVLPSLALGRKPGVAAIYCIDVSTGGRPARFVSEPSARAWFFVPDIAVAFLSNLAAQLPSSGEALVLSGVPDGRPDFLYAIQHLSRHWSASPPVRRYRRHLMEGKLAVVRGFGAIRRLLESDDGGQRVQNWQISDLSRGGVGATAAKLPVGGHPQRGELLSFLPEGGVSWHLGVVRRVLAEEDKTVIGIETLSPRPALMWVDDGRAACEVVFCDPIQKGEAVRIAAPVASLRPGVPLFVTSDHRLQKLKPLDQRDMGEGYELRVYQVL